MEPSPKLKDADSSVVIRQAYTELCSRQERQILNYISTGLFFKKMLLSVCLESCLVLCISSRHCVCCMQVLQSVCGPC